ncbi:hypothetical protein [Edaphosphingomonas haloaromaticamans]|uniref:hypothetical protein n=1 Tax=Edaphosphingomonas haloaromaticamans TaxID=653954 RepID=UPI0008AA0399|nr:hypothetical protein [Sphingomonas haloaromaticamans]
MEYANALEKLGLDLVEPPRLGRIMSEGAEARRETIRRLFYLITIAAEDAGALAVEGQSGNLSSYHARTSAASILEIGMRIEILSSAITELLEGAEKGAEAV